MGDAVSEGMAYPFPSKMPAPQWPSMVRAGGGAGRGGMMCQKEKVARAVDTNCSILEGKLSAWRTTGTEEEESWV